jgi:hypothetical protein
MTLLRDLKNRLPSGFISQYIDLSSLQNDSPKGLAEKFLLIVTVVVTFLTTLFHFYTVFSSHLCERFLAHFWPG